MKRREWLFGGVVFPLLLLTLVNFTTAGPTEDNSRYLGESTFDDGQIYVEMATGQRTFTHEPAAPWCWRILTPAIVRMLPVDPLTGFQLLAFLSSWITVALFYATLRRSGLEQGRAFVALLLFVGVFWSVKFAFAMPTYLDSESLAFVVGVLFCVVASKLWALPVIFTLGVLQRESILLYVPVALFLLWRRRGGWILGAAMIVPPVVIEVLMHRLVTPVNGYSALEEVRQNVSLLRDSKWLMIQPHALLSGLGILPALLLCFPRRTGLLLKAHPEWGLMLLVGIASLFGGIDKSRLYVYSLPVVVLLAGHVLGAMQGWLGRCWMAVTVVLQAYLGNHLSPIGDFHHHMARMVPEHSSGNSHIPYLVVFSVLVAVWVLVTLLTKRQVAVAAAGSSGNG